MDAQPYPSDALPPGVSYRELLDGVTDGVYLIDASLRVLFGNRGAERLTGYAPSEAIGQSCVEGPLGHVDAQGRPLTEDACPLRATLRDGEERECETFFHHRDGRRVPLSVRVSPIHGRGGVLAVVETFSDATPRRLLEEQIAELTRLASMDPLTGLPNRRFAESVLESDLASLQRYGWTFGVLFLDVDHFKLFNDEFGHEVGDDALRVTARALARSVRASDVVARWGGEEFVALLRGVDREALTVFSERCRATVEAAGGPGDSLPLPRPITVSIGGAVAEPSDTAESLLARADAMMYRSKREGRNRVSVA